MIGTEKANNYSKNYCSKPGRNEVFHLGFFIKYKASGK
jgi:hypothetical protein